MHNHTTCDCDHHLKYCRTCDVTYCTKCKREWGVKSAWYPYYPYTTPQWTPTITAPNTGGVTSPDYYVNAHQHS